MDRLQDLMADFSISDTIDEEEEISEKVIIATDNFASLLDETAVEDLPASK